MDKRLYALYSVLIGLLVGALGNLVFFQKQIGLSFPLFVIVALGALFGFSLLARSLSNLRNLWVVIPLLFFAVMVAVRAEASLTLLNIGAVLWLGGLALHYRPAPEALDQQSLLEQAQALTTTGITLLFEPITSLLASSRWLHDHQPFRGTLIRSVGRGLLLAVPILLVFGALLASADAMFSDVLERALSLFQVQGIDGLIEQGVFTIALGWLACGALAYSVLRRPKVEGQFVQVGDADAVPITPESDDEPQTKPRKKHPFLLGIVESGIVLGAVDLLFGFFVVIQFAYFFGGQQNITLERGWTYAEYARRGFFELVAVSVLTLGLILWLDHVTVRANPTQHTIFRVLAVGIVALTAIMLISASGRMSLYEAAYGFTHLRVYTHVFMGWLGMLFAVFLLALFRPNTQIFSLGTNLCIIGFLVTLNLMNVDHTIASQNIARVEQGYELDTTYLYALSADAVPAVLPFYLNLGESATKTSVGRWLSYQWQSLNANRSSATLFSAHLSRDTAWQMLSQIHTELPSR